jgi:acyl carrier protein
MDRSHSLEERLLSRIAVATSLDRDCIDPSMQVVDAGIDSLSLATFVTHVQAELDMELSPAQLNCMFRAETIADIISVVREASGEA